MIEHLKVSSLGRNFASRNSHSCVHVARRSWNGFIFGTIKPKKCVFKAKNDILERMHEGRLRFIQKVEQQESIDSPEKKLESARRFGERYSRVIDAVLGKEDLKSLEREESDPLLHVLVQQALIFIDQQAQRQAGAKLDARGMLLQAFDHEWQKALLEDTGEYRLEELSSGIYSIFIDPDLAHKLRPGAAAMAVSLQNGISFLLIRNYSDKELNQRRLEENIPHETHHLVWAAAQRSESFPSKEIDPDYKRSFLRFQDELLARASTDGALGGYAHIHDLSPNARKELEKEGPGKAQAILDRVSSLNIFLDDLNGLIQRSERVLKRDLVQTIMKAGTFDDLEQGLREMKVLIERFPLKKREQGGWGFVNV